MSSVKQAGSDGHITIKYVDNVAILQMDRGENRLNSDFCEQMLKYLDEIERNTDVKALITTGTGKFYNNGLDIEWLFTSHQDSASIQDFSKLWPQLLTRILTFPMPTIAAINGHTFAGGAMFSLAHDYRVMRSDRGWFSVSEVHVNGVTISALGASITRSKLSQASISDVVVMGKRLTGPDAKDAGIVRAVTSSSDLIPTALNIAHECLPKEGIKRENMAVMKNSIYENILVNHKTEESTKTVELKSNL